LAFLRARCKEEASSSCSSSFLRSRVLEDNVKRNGMIERSEASLYAATGLRCIFDASLYDDDIEFLVSRHASRQHLAQQLSLCDPLHHHLVEVTFDDRERVCAT
jgi:uncharacterized membrane protein affecting hemolysin expression